MKPYVSVIVPLFNEAFRLSHLQQIGAYLKTKPFVSEIIVVDDGSTDQTAVILGRLQKSLPFQRVGYVPNRGKGFAVKTGMLEARGRYRLFLDIDLSTPIETFDRFLPRLNERSVLIASRRIKGAVIQTPQPWLRESLGRCFTFLSRQILQVPVSDFTCGFKCFSEKAAEEIFSRLLIDRWGFDAEALFLAKLLGYSIAEIPVQWENNPQTKVKFPDDIINSFFDLARIRVNDALGRYR